MILSRHGSVYCHLMLAYHYFLQVTENNENAKEKQKKYYKLKKSKGFKTYKFHVGQAVMKANPKKLGGRKGDRMTPDWLDGYVVVSLTEHQVVLRNTKTNKVLKSCSLTHIKPFVERAGGENFDVDAIGDEDANIDDEVAGGEDVGDKVAGGEVVNDKVTGGEVVDDKVAGGEVADDEVAGGAGAVAELVGEEGAGDEVLDVGDKVVSDTVVDAAQEGAEFVDKMRCAASPMFAEEVDHLKQLEMKGIPLRHPYLDLGTTKLTTRDIWCLIPPQELPTCQLKMLPNDDCGFKSGWLTDNVSTVRIT